MNASRFEIKKIVLLGALAFFSPPAPSVAPALRVTSTTSTSISTAWDEIPCLQRNGRIYRYIVSYSLATASSGSSLIPVTDVTNRVLTITDLIPRTSYNIAIRADTEDAINNIYSGQYSSPLTAETAVPQGQYSVFYRLIMNMFSESCSSWFLLEGYVILSECCS